MNPDDASRLVKAISKEIGFDYCGISKADFLKEEAIRLENWLKKNHHGSMGYMERNFDKRLDPRLLFQGTKYVVSLLLNYYPSQTQNEDSPKVSKYAYGKDYHIVIKEKCAELVFRLQEKLGEFNARCFVDSAPVMDKVWAQKSGLGWIGKNSNLIVKGKGSFYFIAELLVDLNLNADNSIKDYCGTCTKCIDACPTSAIVEPYVVDGSKCISYLTIELKDEIDKSFSGKMEDWIFGCDICQDVCPWNSFSKSSNQKFFEDQTGFLDWTKKDWEEITEETFKLFFKYSPLKRTKFQGIKRNLSFISTKTK